VAEKPHDVVVKFDSDRNLQRHRAVLHAIARLLLKMIATNKNNNKNNNKKMGSDMGSVPDPKY